MRLVVSGARERFIAARVLCLAVVGVGSPLGDERRVGFVLPPRFAEAAQAGGRGDAEPVEAQVGMVPRRGDDVDLWSMYFIYVSAVPVFIIVTTGLILAPLGPRLARLGVGLVAGAVASSLLWLVGGSAYPSS